MHSKKLILLVIALSALVIGCQPATNQSQTTSHIGRAARGVSANGATTNGRSWGIIYSNQGDEAFDQELNYLTQPQLAGLAQEDQLGYVSSSQQGASTGVRFYGYARTTSGSVNSGMATFDPSTMMIHIEIIDSNTGQIRSDGTVRPDITIEINPSLSGFVAAQGNIQNGQVNMMFQDGLGTIVLIGQVSGQYLSGTVSYFDSATGGSMRQLGQFTVATCGFLQCN